MKIDLEYPYDKDWKHGYLVINGENRKTIILFNSSDDRSSTSYARYLVSTSLGRYLEIDEHVDHIDHDKTNDVLENLQILKPQENALKESRRKGRLLVEIKCPECGKIFTRRKGNTQAVSCNSGRVTCCSSVCSRLFKQRNLSKGDRELISKNSIRCEFRYHDKE